MSKKSWADLADALGYSRKVVQEDAAIRDAKKRQALADLLAGRRLDLVSRKLDIEGGLANAKSAALTRKPLEDDYASMQALRPLLESGALDLKYTPAVMAKKMTLHEALSASAPGKSSEVNPLDTEYKTLRNKNLSSLLSDRENKSEAPTIPELMQHYYKTRVPTGESGISDIEKEALNYARNYRGEAPVREPAAKSVTAAKITIPGFDVAAKKLGRILLTAGALAPDDPIPTWTAEGQRVISQIASGDPNALDDFLADDGSLDSTRLSTLFH